MEEYIRLAGSNYHSSDGINWITSSYL